MTIITQDSTKSQIARYKLKSVNVSEVLELADLCLQKHNETRARFVATGSAEAFRAALALADDRRVLLGEVGR